MQNFGRILISFFLFVWNENACQLLYISGWFQFQNVEIECTWTWTLDTGHGDGMKCKRDTIDDWPSTAIIIFIKHKTHKKKQFKSIILYLIKSKSNPTFHSFSLPKISKQPLLTAHVYSHFHLIFFLCSRVCVCVRIAQ